MLVHLLNVFRFLGTLYKGVDKFESRVDMEEARKGGFSKKNIFKMYAEMWCICWSFKLLCVVSLTYY